MDNSWIDYTLNVGYQNQNIMKPLLFLAGVAALTYGFVQLGKWIGRKTTPPDWEPNNNEDDQSNNLFV